MFFSDVRTESYVHHVKAELFIGEMNDLVEHERAREHAHAAAAYSIEVLVRVSCARARLRLILRFLLPLPVPPLPCYLLILLVPSFSRDWRAQWLANKDRKGRPT